MKWFLSLTLALAALALPNFAHATAIGQSDFTKVIYLESPSLSPTPSASNSGRDYSSAKPLSDGDLWAVPKNVVITNVYAIVDEALVGGTAWNIGDTDTSNGYIASASPLGAPENLGSTGMHYWDIGYKGSYLKGASAGLTNQLLSKYYSATGKYITLDVTGTFSQGRMRVFIKGYATDASGL